MSSKKYLWAFLLAAALLVAAVGWIVWRRALDQVSVKLVETSLRLDTSGKDEIVSVVADTTFEVVNDNFLGAELESIDYVIFVNGNEVGKGKGPGPKGARGVPANGRAKIVTTTKLPGYQLASAGLDGILKRQVELDVRGKVKLAVLIFDIERDFRVRAPAILGGARGGDIFGLPAGGEEGR